MDLPPQSSDRYRSRYTEIPQQRQPPSPIKSIFAPIIAAIVGFFKYGVGLLKFAPFLKTGLTMLISMGAYTLLYGWKFAVGFVLLIFVHESGHLVAARMCGLKVGAPVFIPFLGASIALKEAPKNAWIEAIIGYGGPLFGTLGGLGAMAIGVATANPLFYALAQTTFFLQIFNMVPIIPLDGGRVVSAISPWLWIVGLLILVPFLIATLSGPGVYILILVATSLPRVWRSFKNRKNPAMSRYFECQPWQRVVTAVAYFGLLCFLAAAFIGTQVLMTAV